MPTARVRVLLTIIVLLVFVLTLEVRLWCDQPSAEEILSKVRDLYRGIEDYTVEVIANIDMPGLRAPEMRAKLYYKSPDKIHVESRGFSILPREGVAPNPGRFEERYTAQLKGEEELEGRLVYRLKLLPKETSEREFETLLLVDKESFVVHRLQRLTEGQPFLTVDFEYELVDDRFLLPSESNVELIMALMPGRESHLRGPGRERIESLFSEEHETPPKNGYASVKFEGYQVNLGLPDSLFEEEGQLRSPTHEEKP